MDANALSRAREAGTTKGARLECPHCSESTPIGAIRGDDRSQRGKGLRLWKNDDLVPRTGDVFGERLYCVRWRLPALDALLQAEQRGEAAPVPEWISLERTIESLTGLLEPAQRGEVARLRQRDWVAEERAVQLAREALETARCTGDNVDVTAARQQLAREEAKVAHRTKQTDMLTASLPRLLYRRVEDTDEHRETRSLDSAADTVRRVASKGPHS